MVDLGTCVTGLRCLLIVRSVNRALTSDRLRGTAGAAPLRAPRRRCLRTKDAAELCEAGIVAGTRGVPPVGVEPTLGTLLGGRPLPLGYGGWVMIPRPVRTILARANRERKIHPGAHIQFVADGP